MNTNDKNRHFVLLIIDISKHGAKEMCHVKMAGPGFVNALIHMVCLIGTSWVITLSTSKDDSVTVTKTLEGVRL